MRRPTLGRVDGADAGSGARKLAAAALKGVQQGADPSADRHAARVRDVFTVGELADLYLAEGPAEKPNKKASSWATDRSNVERHVKPLLGGEPLTGLSAAHVAKFQADVAAGKSRADIKTKRHGRAIVNGGRGHRGALTGRPRGDASVRASAAGRTQAAARPGACRC